MAEHLADSKVAASSGAVRFAALSLLTLREHSRYELQEKLLRRFPDAQLVNEVLGHLAAEALQCDLRFAEAFVRSRISRGQGPTRIASELRQRRVSQPHVETALAAFPKAYWQELASDVCLRRFKTPAKDLKERAKQMRFLQYRGFSTDAIMALWR